MSKDDNLALARLTTNAGLLNGLLLYVDFIFEDFVGFIESHYGDGSEHSNCSDSRDVANVASFTSKDISLGRVHLNSSFFMFFLNSLSSFREYIAGQWQGSILRSN